MPTGLTRKAVLADRNLATLIGVPEGELVSYADIQRGLHEYIKRNNLRIKSGLSAAPSYTGASSNMEGPVLLADHCISCGTTLLNGTIFCDQCGTRLVVA